MSKYCPMCDEITNCTENCTKCMEEEEKKNSKKTVDLADLLMEQHEQM